MLTYSRWTRLEIWWGKVGLVGQVRQFLLQGLFNAGLTICQLDICILVMRYHFGHEISMTSFFADSQKMGRPKRILPPVRCFYGLPTLATPMSHFMREKWVIHELDILAVTFSIIVDFSAYLHDCIYESCQLNIQAGICASHQAYSAACSAVHGHMTGWRQKHGCRK